MTNLKDAYGASKAAMIRLSKSLAIQFASNNIRSNIILPGPIETGMQKKMEKKSTSQKEFRKVYSSTKEWVQLKILLMLRYFIKRSSKTILQELKLL